MVFSRLFLAAVLFASAAPLTAQVAFQPLAISDADALAEQMRRLGTNPLDLDALLTAGELSLRLGDLSAAGAFFSRVDRIDPRNPRAKAGEGGLLVRSERPGEALRLFAQAETMGLAPMRFAADRGLAYDLTGDGARAQRDYKLALGVRDDDETRRRYALSLAIAGKQAQALDLLAPLIRRNDRAAWRSRAFILAMGGNGAEASRIAQTMMPPGSAAGLQGFFAELPHLPAIDRAFAVHFGEVHPTAARLADARLAPAQAALPVEVVPVQVAAVSPSEDRGRKRKKDKRAPVVLAAALPPARPVEVLAQPPAFQPPTFQPPVYQPRADVSTARVSPTDRPLTTGELASLAAAGMRSPARAAVRATPAPGFSPIVSARAPSPTEQANRALAVLPPRPLARTEIAVATPVAVVPAPVVAVTRPTVGRMAMPDVAAIVPVRVPETGLVSQPTVVTALPVVPPSAISPTIAALPSTPPAAVVQPTVPPTAGSASTVVAGTPDLASPVAVATLAPVPTVAAAIPAEATTDVETPPVPIPSTVAPPEVAAVPTPALPRLASIRTARPSRLGRADADSILARIVANLAIPASELGVEAGTRPTAAERRRADRAADRAVDRDRVAQAAADKPAPADRKLLAVKKAAADKKALADKESAAAKKAERGEPERIWVQVAGGANEGDLDKAWSSVRKKAPGALAGRQAWTTPLRATNRVLTGPFRTDAEARAYVNNLAKSGVSAFTFTSEAGQKVSRLSTR